MQSVVWCCCSSRRAAQLRDSSSASLARGTVVQPLASDDARRVATAQRDPTTILPGSSFCCCCCCLYCCCCWPAGGGEQKACPRVSHQSVAVPQPIEQRHTGGRGGGGDAPAKRPMRLQHEGHRAAAAGNEPLGHHCDRAAARAQRQRDGSESARFNAKHTTRPTR